MAFGRRTHAGRITYFCSAANGPELVERGRRRRLGDQRIGTANRKARPRELRTIFSVGDEGRENRGLGEREAAVNQNAVVALFFALNVPEGVELGHDVVA